MARMGYQYGTSPRKLEPEYSPNRKRKSVKKQAKKQVKKTIQRQNIQLSKEQKMKNVKHAITVLALFILLFTISYRNSLINENFKKVQTLKENLALIKKENEQLQVSIENGLNLNNLEQEAKEKLGMQKLTNKQTEYISLPKKDYVEPANEDMEIQKDENLIQKILNKIFNR